MTLSPSILESLRPPLPELAGAISAVTESVCQQHIREVQTELPSGATLPDIAALDDLLVVLDALADAFRSENGGSLLEMVGPPHASARDGQGFTIDELITEHALLRRSLQAAVARHLGRSLDPGEHAALQAGVDVIMMLTVASFTAQRSARARLENTAMSHFLASLAHDLRNEINSVMTSLELLQELGTDLRAALGTKPEARDRAAPHEQLDEFMQDVRTCHQTMESTVAAMTRLLEAERLRHRITAHPRDVDLQLLLAGVARSAGRGARRSVENTHALDRIDIDCPPNLVVQTDPDLLGTVLVNLVGNAVRHAANSAIRVAAVPLTSGGCRIDVRDEGPGIAPGQVERLFEKFERGATSSPGSGLGLGLFIARRAAALLGARLTVQSTPGAGSCFSLELPEKPLAIVLPAPA